MPTKMQNELHSCIFSYYLALFKLMVTGYDNATKQQIRGEIQHFPSPMFGTEVKQELLLSAS
jgi:Holliday junction resolvasome RuvABC endonuclease subunit